MEAACSSIKPVAAVDPSCCVLCCVWHARQVVFADVMLLNKMDLITEEYGEEVCVLRPLLGFSWNMVVLIRYSGATHFVELADVPQHEGRLCAWGGGCQLCLLSSKLCGKESTCLPG